MKNKKRNSEKLLDSLSVMQDRDIADCMLTDIPRAKSEKGVWLTYRRVWATAAACLALVAVLGAAVVIPMTMQNSPSAGDGKNPPVLDNSTTSAGQDTLSEGNTNPTPGVTQLSYYNAPVVKLQSLASAATLSGETTDDGDVPVYEQAGVTFDTAYLNHLFFRENMLLAFDIGEGESITVTSQSQGINPMTYPEDYPFDADQATQLEWLKTYCGKFSWSKDRRVESHTLTASDAFLMWNSTEKTTMGEDILTFVIRNAEGQITGAGSILMVKYRPIEYTGNFFYDKASLVRWSVLGSVRFDQPEQATEEAVGELLADMNAKAEDAKAEMSFAPANRQENYIMALVDMVNTCYDVAGSRQMGYVDFYTATDCSYFKVNIDGYRDGLQRQFLLYEDGTWQELASDSFWVLTDHLAGTKVFFHANFLDGTTRHMDEERAIYDAEDAVYYGYHFWANNVIYMEKDKAQFELSLDNIMHFMFVQHRLSGPFSYRATPYKEDHDFREVFFTVEDKEYHFIVFSGGSWGLVYEDSGYADPEALTGRKIVFWTGLVFELEWQDVYKDGVEEPVHMLAPTYLDEVVVITGQIFEPKE